MQNRDVFLQKIRDFLLLNTYPSSYLVLGMITSQRFNLSEIDAKLRPTLFHIQFLINPRVVSFIRSLPELRQKLAKSSNLEEEVTSGVVRGPINWGKTISLRLTQGSLQMPIYSTKIRNKTFELPHNKLLVFLLNALNKLLIETKIELDEIDNTDVLANESLKFKDYITFSSYQVKKTLQSPYLENVMAPQVINQKLLDVVESSRNEHYVNLSELYRFYEFMIIQKDEGTLEESIIQSYLERIKEEDLMEMAVAVNIILSINSQLPTVIRKYGLFSSNSDYLITWELPKGNLSLSLYNLPPFIDSTVYKSLLDKLGVTLKMRMPDISLSWEGHDGSKWVHFVEVKYTNASSEYFRASLYKVMGYVKDFEDWYSRETVAPKITLVISSGLKRAVNDGEIYVIEYADNESIRKMTEDILNGLPS